MPRFDFPKRLSVEAVGDRVGGGVDVGVAGVAGSWLISQAYRLSEAAFAAPFEYVAMPIAIFWGAVFFDTWPTLNAWAGIVLILGSGLYMLWREHRISGAPPAPRYRR